MTIPRYDIDVETIRNPIGDFILYSDHASIIAKLRAILRGRESFGKFGTVQCVFSAAEWGEVMGLIEAEALE